MNFFLTIWDKRQKDLFRQSYVNAFMLAFFGTFIFPKTMHSFDAVLVDVIIQVIQGLNYVTTLLAEHLRSVDHAKDNEGGVLGCPSLLQFWFLSHIHKINSSFSHHLLSENQIIGIWNKLKILSQKSHFQ